MELAKPLRWDTLMERLARRLKRLLKEASRLDNDADKTPDALAFQDFILDFPFPTQMMLVEAGTDSATTMTRTFTLVRFDLTQPRSSAADYYGCILAKDGTDRIPSLRYFGMQSLDALEKANAFTAATETGNHFSFCVPFNISKNLDRYAEQMFGFLSHEFMPHIQRRYRCRYVADFNAKYNLTSDPILPREQLLMPHPFSHSMGGAGKLTVEDLQTHVADIQLISQVPPDVRSTFEAAKQLYVFGYFQWRFFTVARHYACLAMEAAVKHRWIQSLQNSRI